MKKNLRYYLKSELSAKELELVPSSFDVVGDIMIFSDFPKELSKKEKLISKIILENYRHVKSIYKKTGQYSGKYRTPKLKLIAGEKRKETIHKENNVILKLDVEKVYFSPRSSNERKRISKLVKPNEKILVMFCGCGPYPLEIAKNSKSKIIHGIEANPIAHKYALENLKLNKLDGRVTLHKGDVRKIIPKIRENFNRIVMPLPKDAEKFLDAAFKASKKGTIIHLYTFHDEKNLGTASEIVKDTCKSLKKKCKILGIVKCGHYSPGYLRVCIDFKIL